MCEGTVSAIKAEGYGFIRRSRASDVFFHRRDMVDDAMFDERLVERRVRFELRDTDRGPRASNVQLVD